MICKKKHRYLDEYERLSNAQDNKNGDRHICAGCAYEEGLRDALSGYPPKNDLSHLPFSQAGTVRHKDAKEAYDEGSLEGKKRTQ